MKLLALEIRRAIFSRRVVISMLFYTFFLLFSSIYKEWNFSTVYIFSKNTSAAFYILCFVCAAFVYSDSFIIDYKSGIWRQILIRASVKEYCTAKVISTFLGGFLSVTLGLILYVNILLILFPINNDFHIDYSGYAELINSHKYFLFFLIKISLTSTVSASFSLCSLACSTLILNRLFSIAFPLSLYYCANELTYIIKAPLYLNVTPMLYTSVFPEESLSFNILFAILFFGLIGTLAGAYFYHSCRGLFANG